MATRFQDIYFDLVYAPVYDYTVARMAPYRRFMEDIAGRVSLRQGSMILGVGAGTGNEFLHLAKAAHGVPFSMVAVDLSRRSLSRARQKCRNIGQNLQTLRMDGHSLAFGDNQFDTVLCLHAMDFMEDSISVTREILRVLKKGGEFIITYPTGRGARGLATDLRSSIAGNLRRGRFLKATGEAVVTLGAAVAYAPLALSLRGRRPLLSRSSIESLMESSSVKDFTISEDPAYQDIVVLGKR